MQSFNRPSVISSPAKVADIGLGSAATVVYTKEGDKNIASSIVYLPAKGE